MGNEQFIHGKKDNAHHVGHFSNIRARAESQIQIDEAQQFFAECYGIPFSSALQLSKLPGDVGVRWRKVLEHINNLVF